MLVVCFGGPAWPSRTNLLPATVRASPCETVDKSNFTDDTPKRMQKTINWGKNANLMLVGKRRKP